MTNVEFLAAVRKNQQHYQTTYWPFLAAELEAITERDVELAFAEHQQYSGPNQ